MRGLSTSHVPTNRNLTENTPLLIRPGKAKAKGIGASSTQRKPHGNCGVPVLF